MNTTTRPCRLLGLCLVCAIACDPSDGPAPDLSAPDLATPVDLGASADLLPALVTLTVNASGAGTVSAPAQGLRCTATTCRVTVPAATQITLSVQAEPKQQFSGWGGQCSGGAGSCTLTLQADTTVSASFAPKTCAASDWCKENSGQTAALYGVYAQGPRNVLAVGANGTVLHFDGGSWSTVQSGTTATLRSVWFASATEAWMVGTQGTVLRYDAGVIRPVTSPVTSQLNGVSGASPSEIYMVGTGGVVLTYDGTALTPLNSGTNVDLLATWVAASKNVFVSTADSSQSVGLRVGYSLLSYDGATWQKLLRIPVKTSISMAGLHGTDPSNLWLAGDGSGTGPIAGGCLWYRGAALGSGVVGCSKLLAVWTAAPTDTWMAGEGGVLKHWNGTAFDGQHPSYNIPSGTGAALQGLHGTSSTNIWAVGQAGTILHLEK